MFKNNVEVHGSYITGNITNSLERNEAEFRIKLFFSTTPNNLKTLNSKQMEKIIDEFTAIKDMMKKLETDLQNIK